MLGADEKPDVRYEDVGGLDAQKQEIREAVELPLTQVGCFWRYLSDFPWLTLWVCFSGVSSTCIERSVSILRVVCCYMDRLVSLVLSCSDVRTAC